MSATKHRFLCHRLADIRAYLQLLCNLLPIPVFEVLLVLEPSLLYIIRPGMQVWPVADQLAEPLQIGRKHSLRVREDFGHVYWNSYLGTMGESLRMVKYVEDVKRDSLGIDRNSLLNFFLI